MKKILILIMMLFSQHVFGQPIISILNNDTTINCGGGLMLTAVVTPQGVISYAPDSYTTGTVVANMTDDIHSDVIPIGFNFCYLGNTYNSLVISSNNYVTFNLSMANQFSPWVTVPVATVNPNQVLNSIMGPWQDINPGMGGTIRYQVYGIAPYRHISISWYQVPMFQCTNILYTSQIKLFETTGMIESHIQSRQFCPWNSGNAVHALHNATGNWADVVFGRNNTPFTVNLEGYRWIPGIVNPTINWYENGFLIGTGLTINVNPTQNTQYVVELVSGSSCGSFTYSDTVMVNLNGNLPTNLFGVSNFCDTITDQLFYTTTPDSIYNLSWYLNNTLVGFGDSLYLDLLESGIDTLFLMGFNNSCQIDTFIVLNIKESPPPINFDPICYGFPEQLPLLGGDDITWGGQYVNNDTLTPPRAGNYNLNYVIDVDTCSYNGVTSIMVKEAPLLLSISDMNNQVIELCDNNKKIFNYSIVGDEDVFYSWGLYHNGRLIKRSNDVIFSHKYDKIGDYELSVVTEKDGCLSDALLNIRIEPCRYTTFFVPNSFSPNDDGLNDLFKPIGLYFKDLTITIFNGWGEKIYTSSDLSGWDGTYKGVKSPQGVYFYEIVYKDINDYSQRLIGNITLYR